MCGGEETGKGTEDEYIAKQNKVEKGRKMK